MTSKHRRFTCGLFLFIISLTNGYRYPFLDPDLPWDKRVDDLVGRLTLEEVIAQTMTDPSYPHTPEIPRLGIKPYVWNTECNRGQVTTNSTAFPQDIGLAATFK